MVVALSLTVGLSVLGFPATAEDQTLTIVTASQDERLSCRLGGETRTVTTTHEVTTSGAAYADRILSEQVGPWVKVRDLTVGESHRLRCGLPDRLRERITDLKAEVKRLRAQLAATR